MDARERLLRQLADGRLHSGTDLAAALGMSRAAVWKHLARLGECGLVFEARRGVGYRLPAPIEMLDAGVITRNLDARTGSVLDSLDVCWELDSTSDHLLKRSPAGNWRLRACFAEYQSGGRGRRGRRWLSPIGSGLCMSVAWCFPSAPADFHALGLAAGVAVMRALRRVGVARAQLKWPNDIMHGDAKLAGILLDVQGESDGPLVAVTGVGLNLNVSRRLEQEVSAAGGILPAGLDSVMGAGSVSRNELGAALVTELVAVMDDFERSGFSQLADEWSRDDWLRGREISVVSGGQSLRGVARGISRDGRLRLETDAAIHDIISGDVSVVAAP